MQTIRNPASCSRTSGTCSHSDQSTCRGGRSADARRSFSSVPFLLFPTSLPPSSSCRRRNSTCCCWPWLSAGHWGATTSPCSRPRRTSCWSPRRAGGKRCWTPASWTSSSLWVTYRLLDTSHVQLSIHVCLLLVAVYFFFSLIISQGFSCLFVLTGCFSFLKLLTTVFVFSYKFMCVCAKQKKNLITWLFIN